MLQSICHEWRRHCPEWADRWKVSPLTWKAHFSILCPSSRALTRSISNRSVPALLQQTKLVVQQMTAELVGDGRHIVVLNFNFRSLRVFVCISKIFLTKYWAIDDPRGLLRLPKHTKFKTLRKWNPTREMVEMDAPDLFAVVVVCSCWRHFSASLNAHREIDAYAF